MYKITYDYYFLTRMIYFQITLGGDTDTIGSMTGALAGAFYGEDKFSNNLLEHCEGSKKFAYLGEKLYNIVMDMCLGK